ncbi:FG-GAP repeat domain-containing protein [Streptomyces sp. R39]|uniref:FG-GAP repeat domain-containing protein n=1 Tax=Streptomyces sp. R39 TaxID=3238631 RepID=A0AB39R4Q5_9ACTN
MAVATLAASTWTAAAEQPRSAAAANTPRTDFDHDGKADIAIGAPGGTVGGGAGAGYVSVVYGDGATATFSQNTAGVPGAAEANDKFGQTVVPVDLDGDSYTDLVVGTPGERIGQVQAGMLTVLWGGPDGLGAATAVDTGAKGGGSVGLMVTAGDFDGDGRPGLALRGPSWSVRFLNGIDRDGKVAKDSLYPLYNDEGPASPRDLSSGDVNGDGITDLVVTVTDDEEGDSWRSALYLGGKAGLTRVGILTATNGKRLNGQHTAVGDLNHDGYGDIVVGHGEEWDSDSGRPEIKGDAVGVAYGGPRGLSDTLAPVWVNQDSAGVPGVSEPGDGMGAGLAVADADGDGYADVLAGVPGEDFDGLVDAGAVLFLKGGPQGLTGKGARVFSQNSAGVPGVAEKDDAFGESAALGGRLVVGDPDENAGNGSVWALSLTGNSAAYSPGSFGDPATKAGFGDAVAGG